MNREVRESVVYLNKHARRKNLLFELGLIAGFLVISFLLYYFYSKQNIILILVPIGLLLFLRLFLFLRDNKALVLHNGRLYACRSGFVARKEMEKAYIAQKKGLFSQQKCIFFDLETGGLYEPTVFADWSLYTLPSTIIALCQSDVDMPLEDVLAVIKNYAK